MQFIAPVYFKSDMAYLYSALSVIFDFSRAFLLAVTIEACLVAEVDEAVEESEQRKERDIVLILAAQGCAITSQCRAVACEVMS